MRKNGWAGLRLTKQIHNRIDQFNGFDLGTICFLVTEKVKDCDMEFIRKVIYVPLILGEPYGLFLIQFLVNISIMVFKENNTDSFQMDGACFLRLSLLSSSRLSNFRLIPY